MTIAWAVAVLALQGAPQEAPPAEKRTDALRRLYEKDRAGYGDALRLVLGLAKDAPVEGDFASVQREAADRGLVDGAWALAEGAPVDKGTVAYMLVQALGIKGGLTMRIFGPSRRYAFRECVYRKLIGGGTPGEHVTGRELIDILAAAEDHKQGGTLDADRR
ncbi:MAG TPA: hypothetical protein VEJ18_00640 [Planctomycetota bacterium]|nr:hypothetical protein [Planctomycetota bacterium]